MQHSLSSWSDLRKDFAMALWVSRSRSITHLFKTKISSFEIKRCSSTHSLFHLNSSYKSLGGSRRSNGLCDRMSASGMSFRRSESARAGEHVAYTDEDDDDEKQVIFEKLVLLFFLLRENFSFSH